MIDLEFERNNDGAYILDPEIIERDYQVSYNVNEITGVVLDCSYWLDNGEQKVLAKTLPSNPKPYLMSIFGELLFSKFAQKNNIPCADVDMGIHNGMYYTLSKSVIDKDEQKISVRDLRRYCNNEDDHRLATVKEVCSLLGVFSEKYDVSMVPKIDFKLKVYGIVDYLVAQRDRNITNLIFGLKETEKGKVINLKPLIDNEGCFGFIYLYQKYMDTKIPQASFLYKSRKNRRKVNKFVKQASLEGKKYELPVFGIKTVSRFDWDELGLKEFFAEIFNKSETKKFKDKVCLEIASEIRKDVKLKGLFKNLTFDANECGDEIFKETGIKIPKEYLMLAQEVFDTRKNDIYFALDKLEQSEMGG